MYVLETEKKTSGTRRKVTKETDPCFKFWNVPGHRQIHCEICFKHPLLVKLWGPSQIPPITKTEGAQFRRNTVEHHLNSVYHKKCVEAEKMRVLTDCSTRNTGTVLEKMISKAHQQIANTIGSHALMIYNDAKRLTLSAYSWPSRALSNEFGRLFDFNDPTTNKESMIKTNLQYLNPKMHAEIMESIVASESELIKRKIEESIAMSLRVDGSVDRMNIDKIYILAKLVNREGSLETVFIGVGQQKKRYAAGLYEAIKTTINNISPGLYDTVLNKMSSLVTDGASINTGEHKGLWALIDRDLELSQREFKQVILKLWCAAHRSDLALKDLSKDVPELSTFLSNMTKISSYFGKSGLRVAALHKIAEDNDLPFLRLPRYFEVRWSQFTHQLLSSILTSWHALVLYFSSENAAEAVWYHNLLRNYVNLRMLSFTTDLIFTYQRFQKKLQANDLNLVSLKKHLTDMQSAIDEFDVGPIPGGWEHTLMRSVDVTECWDENDSPYEIYTLKGEELTSDREKRAASNRTKDFSYLRRSIINSLRTFLRERFVVEEEIMTVLSPFISFDRTNTDIEEIHRFIAPDVDLVSLNLQFREICAKPLVKKMPLRSLVSHLAQNDESSCYEEILIVLARLIAATPHSADVERSISANNLLKTNLRSSLDLSTENKYLHIHYNMPPITKWDPRKTVIDWIKKKERRHHNLAIENESHKAKNQPHFNGIFINYEHVTEKENEIDFHSMSENNDNQPKRRKF